MAGTGLIFSQVKGAPQKMDSKKAPARGRWAGVVFAVGFNHGFSRKIYRRSLVLNGL